MAPTVGEILFVDTNILLTATDERRSGHRDAQRLFNESRERGYHLGASGQILREYLVVATRPVSMNGLGLDTADAVANINELRRYVRCFEENEEVSHRLRKLAIAHGISGRRLHDANIAATMLAHGIERVVTRNAADFASFDGIEVVDLPVGDA